MRCQLIIFIIILNRQNAFSPASYYQKDYRKDDFPFIALKNPYFFNTHNGLKLVRILYVHIP